MPFAPGEDRRYDVPSAMLRSRRPPPSAALVACRWGLTASLLLLPSAACSSPTGDVEPPAPACAQPAASSPLPGAPHPHPQIDGRAFPDHVLALTWDDGPDRGTLRLAGYLASHHISATFFVVDEWAGDLSEEPGVGPHEFETGYRFIPVLGDLVALGHRLGNHTANHVLLAAARASVVDFELAENQKNLDPFLTNELRLFRSPGGAWDEGAGAVVDRDPALRGMVGPVRWDIDRKDWEGSLYCRSDRPAVECEPAAPGHRSRVRAEVTARRYLSSIAQAGHGIVLFHDRVGDVGSDYALRVASRVIPALEDEGYVFAAPVLELSPFRSRLGDTLTTDWVASLDPSTVTLRDVDGDGRADLCGRGTGGFGCARSIERPGTADDGRPQTVFVWSRGWNLGARADDRAGRSAGALQGDLNGDGRADECHLAADGLRCALAGPHGMLDASLWLARSRKDASSWLDGDLFLVDVNGDGRADLCSVRERDVGCALAP
jgi:peptidoglycan/xylan/chitin deacetylase (PgdA/CDA1 family)